MPSTAPAATPFGLTLQALRAERGYSIHGLGKRAQVDAAYIWRLERGEKSDPSLTVFRKLCQALDITPEAFLTALLRVEEAAAAPAQMAGMAQSLGDPDEAIFAELVSSRAAAEAERAVRQTSWRLVKLPPKIPPAGARLIPVLGKIAAGGPIRVEEAEILREIATPAAGLPPDPQLFAVQVQGLSMNGVDILPDDEVIVSPAATSLMSAEDVAVCRLFGSEITLKHVWRTDTGYLLRAANPQFPDLCVNLEDCDVLGIVVRIHRS
ncbi:MAG: S24 family peptidase [bacterium]